MRLVNRVLIITGLFFFNTLYCLGQNKEKWKEYVDETNEISIYKESDVLRFINYERKDSLKTLYITYRDSLIYYRSEFLIELSKCNNLNTVFIYNFDKKENLNELFYLIVSNIPAKKVKHLILSGDSLTNLLPIINRFKNLETLELTWNKINDLEPVLEVLVKNKSLKSLEVSYNPIRKLPEIEGLYGKLKGLGINGTELDSLPCFLIYKTRLFSIDFSYNSKIKALPKCTNELNRIIWFSVGRDFYINNCNEIKRLMETTPAHFENLGECKD
jgi:hypothetical protein